MSGLLVAQRAVSSSILGNKLLQLKYIIERDLVSAGLGMTDVSMLFEAVTSGGIIGANGWKVDNFTFRHR